MGGEPSGKSVPVSVRWARRSGVGFSGIGRDANDK